MKVEGICSNNQCRSVVKSNHGHPNFRHVMLAQASEPLCPLCETELIKLKEVPTEHLFPLGNILSTKGAMDVLGESGHSAQSYLRRHVRGDWGILDEHDWGMNERAVRALPPNRGRLMSKYRVGQSQIYIITEAGRHETTILEPSEY